MPPVQLDLFNVEPDWLIHLRTLPHFEYVPYEKGLAQNYWRPAGLYRWRGLEKGNDVGVNVGHWHEWDERFCETMFFVLILFEDGCVEKFLPHDLFPAPKPDWWQGWPVKS